MGKSEVILGESPGQHPSRAWPWHGAATGEPPLATPGVSWASPFTTNSSVKLRPRLLSHGDNTEHKRMVPTPWTCYNPGQRFSIRARVPHMDTGNVQACLCLFQFRVGVLLASGRLRLGMWLTSYNAQDGPTTKNDSPRYQECQVEEPCSSGYSRGASSVTC